MDILPPDAIPQQTRDTPSAAPKRICVIGAGSAGLAVLKVLSATPQHKSGLWEIVAYEAREDVGGVWLPVPVTSTADPPLTPMYDSLTTNLPHSVMAYPSFSFPPSTPVFPRASVVQEYLKAYAAHFNLNPLIRLNTSVEHVQWHSPKWSVQISGGETLHFDFVAIANGHYRVPRYPDTPGVSHWLQTKRASHAAWYRHPQNYGNVVLVVGAGSSGQDISSEMRTAAHTVIHSVTDGIKQCSGNLKTRGRVKEFKPDGSVLFEDGTVESGIDHCILATGYQIVFPFLPDSIVRTGLPPTSPPLPRDLYNSRYHVFPLARHLFPLQMQFPPASIAFMSLLTRVAPYPLVEAQAHAIVRVLEQPEALDVTREAVDIMTRYEDLKAQFGDDALAIAKGWHVFGEMEQFEYTDRLYEFAGVHYKAPEWLKEMYVHKLELRSVWRHLEETGEAQDWVRGVGEGGEHEWEALLRRMLARSEDLERSQEHDARSARL